MVAQIETDTIPLPEDWQILPPGCAKCCVKNSVCRPCGVWVSGGNQWINDVHWQPCSQSICPISEPIGLQALIQGI